MSERPNSGIGSTSPVANPDGSITFAGYTIPAGSAQHDDVARLQGEDPKAAYLLVARYKGNRGVCRRWPAFGAMAGLGGGT